MKKIFLVMFLSIIWLLAACKKNESNGHNISPYKNYSETTKLDFIAFGVNHRLESWGFGTTLDPSIDLTDIDMAYIHSPLGRDRLSMLNKEDIINLNVLDSYQKDDFLNYIYQTNSNNFNISFCISNDLNSKYFKKQIIKITNLDYIKSEKVSNQLGYHLFYESNKLDLNKIIQAAELATKATFTQTFLNDDFTGIFLHSYEKSA